MSGMEIVGLKFVGDDSQLKSTLASNQQAVQNYARGVQGAMDKSAQSVIGYERGLRALTSGPAVLGVGGLSIVLVQQFSAAIIDAQVKSDKLRNTLASVVGASAVSGEMVYLRDTTQSLGLEFVSTAQQYAKLSAAAKGTALEGRGVKEIFEAVGQASVVLGLGAEESEGALRAIQQMMSKGKVQAEELRGQLGERLPGAFQIAARAMGVTTGELDKMLERGEVFAADFLPRFAEELKKSVAGGLNDAVNSTQASLNRYSNAWMAAKLAVAQSGVSSAITSEINGVASMFDRVSESINVARLSGRGFWGQMDAGAGSALLYLNPLNLINGGVKTLGQELASSELKLQSLNASLAARADGNSNFYLRAEIAQTQKFIEETRLAIKFKSDLLSGGDNSVNNAESARFERFGLAARQAADAKQKDESLVAAVGQRLSGQSERFQSTVAQLKGAMDRGNLTEKKYTEMVVDLIKKEGGVKDPSGGGRRASASESVYSRMNEAIGKKIELTKAEILGEAKLSDAGKYRLQTLREINHQVEIKRLKPAEAKGLRERVEQAAAEMRMAQSLREQVDAREKVDGMSRAAYETRQREIDQLVDGNNSLREEIELLGLDEQGRAHVERARLASLVSRKEEALIVAQSNDLGAEMIAQLERELELLRQRQALMGGKEEKERQQEVDKQQSENRKKEADELERRSQGMADTLSDAIMRGSLSGRKIMDVFLDDLKEQWKKTILTPTIKPFTDILSGGVASFISGFKGGGFSGIFPGLTGPSGGGGFSDVGGLGEIGGSVLEDILGGFYANGGEPPLNKVSVVGEQGAELFIPRTAGTIVPNSKLGGMTFAPTTSIVIHGGGADSNSLRAEFNQALAARDKRWANDLADMGVTG